MMVAYGCRTIGRKAGLLSSQVLLQRLVLEAADTAEEVYFPGAHTEIDIVSFRGHRAPGTRKIGRYTFFPPTSGCIDRRQKFGALNAVYGPGPFNVQGCQPEVAVVAQGHLDELLKALVREVLPPLELRYRRSDLSSLSSDVSCSFRPIGGNGSCKSCIIRGQCATTYKGSIILLVETLTLWQTLLT